MKTIYLGFKAWRELERVALASVGNVDARLLPTPASPELQKAVKVVPAPLIADIRKTKRLKPATAPAMRLAGLVGAVLILSAVSSPMAAMATTLATGPGGYVGVMLFWLTALWTTHLTYQHVIRLVRFLGLLCTLGNAVLAAEHAARPNLER